MSLKKGIIGAVLLIIGVIILVIPWDGDGTENIRIIPSLIIIIVGLRYFFRGFYPISH
jgi:hypothetical protein